MMVLGWRHLIWCQITINGRMLTGVTQDLCGSAALRTGLITNARFDEVGAQTRNPGAVWRKYAPLAWRIVSRFDVLMMLMGHDMY